MKWRERAYLHPFPSDTFSSSNHRIRKSGERKWRATKLFRSQMRSVENFLVIRLMK